MLVADTTRRTSTHTYLASRAGGLTPCRRPRAALGQHRPAARTRVLSLAGLGRVLIGGRARGAARARVRGVQRDGRTVVCVHFDVYERCRTTCAWRLPTKRMTCAHVMCL